MTRSGAGFDIDIDNQNMSSLSLNFLTNLTLATRNPRRDTSISTVIAGLPRGRYSENYILTEINK